MANTYTFQLPANQLPSEISALLLIQWVGVISADHLGLTSTGSGGSSDGGQTYTFGDVTSSHFILETTETWDEWTLATTSLPNEGVVVPVIEEALAKVAAQDFGPDVVYEIGMKTATIGIDSGIFFQLMRALGDQVRIVGKRRLCDRVLLEFTETPPKVPGTHMLFAPETTIRALIFSPGPSAGDLSRRTAAGIAETVASICTLALGRVVNLPPAATTFPATEEVTEEAKSIQSDPSILTLARNSISLDIFGDLAALGGTEATIRAQRALLSYHSALTQSSTDVATMLFISAIEALIAPHQEWGKEKVTKRFIKGVQQLCPNTVNELMAHPNVEVAFGLKLKGSPSKRRYALLNQLYDMRSVPTHTGIGLSSSGALTAASDPGSMRFALLSDLTRAAILGYLQGPFSSLVGHPQIDPPATA
ncbi:hypothetical protein [Streptomyces sp. NPDC050416]|uniref:hypothetical protein n=1 Tax=Streptomyces sp. NPDC050416 TaxID=3365611 RepID=UPI0037895806